MPRLWPQPAPRKTHEAAGTAAASAAASAVVAVAAPVVARVVVAEVAAASEDAVVVGAAERSRSTPQAWRPDAVAAVLGEQHLHPAALEDARQREDVAHVVVDDQHLLAVEHLVRRA